MSRSKGERLRDRPGALLIPEPNVVPITPLNMEVPGWPPNANGDDAVAAGATPGDRLVCGAGAFELTAGVGEDA